MQKTYAVLGAGMQGTAAAFDLANFGNPQTIRMGDARLDQAKIACQRVNTLVGRHICEPFAVDALNPDSLAEFLYPVDVLLSCVPYWMHPKIAKVAIATNTHMLDLGGNTEVTLETLGMDEEAKAAGVTLIPDNGLAPGLVNSLGLALIEKLDSAESVKLYCGVLPQHPVPPLNYKLTFNVEGLLTEYDFQAVVIRDGKIAMVDTLAELEELDIEGFGTMEAFTTSGGTSTAPYTLKDRLKNYEYKTIRFPGHCEKIKLFRDFGFWSEDPIEVRGAMVKPREVFYKVFGDALSKYEDTDQCLVRGVGVGMKDGVKIQVQVDIHDRQCPDTGFTSMERLTGFSLSLHAIDVANGLMPTGALKYETAMSGARFCELIQQRGVKLTFGEATV